MSELLNRSELLSCVKYFKSDKSVESDTISISKKKMKTAHMWCLSELSKMPDLVTKNLICSIFQDFVKRIFYTWNFAKMSNVLKQPDRYNKSVCPCESLNRAKLISVSEQLKCQSCWKCQNCQRCHNYSTVQKLI